jgi:hypothetical protein
LLLLSLGQWQLRIAELMLLLLAIRTCLTIANKLHHSRVSSSSASWRQLIV